MKRNLFIIVSIFLGIIVIMLMGNVITIGDKIYDLTGQRALEIGFYCLILLAFFYILVYPLVKLHAAPQFPKLSVDAYVGETEKTAHELKSFARTLARNLHYLPKEERKQHRNEFLQAVDEYYNVAELRSVVQKELDARYDLAKSHLYEWAKTVFMLTAVSQNGKLDAAISMVINFRMIADLVRCSGFRPTHRQLFNQYVRILATALFSYYLSNTLEDIDLTSLSAGDTAGDAMIDGVTVNEGTIMETDFLGSITGLKIMNLVPASLADGALNALLTLRIGYVTIAYLQKGSKELSGKKGVLVRRHAMLQSVKAFGVIAKDSTVSGLSLMGEKISELLAQGRSKSAEQV